MTTTPEEVLGDQTNAQIREAFRIALRKPVVTQGFMRLICEGLVADRLGPLTAQEYWMLVHNIRGVLEELHPGWLEGWPESDEATPEIARQLAADYLAD
jgi:hypothetical protein